MSVFPRGSTHTILLILCGLCTLDIALRWWSVPPVEATRISGRETDAAFESLSGANQNLAQANMALAASFERLSSELRAMGLNKFVDAQKAAIEAQGKQAKAAELLAAALNTAADALKAMDRGAPKSGEMGEEPVKEEEAEPSP